MAERGRRRTSASAVLQVRDLHVYYGQSHALQGVNLTLERGVQTVVGRNGMGKTTLCHAVTGLLRPRRGSIRFRGEEIGGLAPYQIAARGIGYTPQGRRLWPTLTVEEHFRLVESRGGAWTVDRIYETFPRLYERRRSVAGQLSGGEQQMVAISRALLQDPELLVLDEPTEGLAPVVVSQVQDLLADLAAHSDVSILLIEQNIAVAAAISEQVAIMVNGRISRVMPAQELAGDRTLQGRLLGVGRHSREDLDLPPAPLSAPRLEPDEVERPEAERPEAERPEVERPEVERPEAEKTGVNTLQASAAEAPESTAGPRSSLAYVAPTRWSSAAWTQDAARTQDAAAPREAPPAVVRPFDARPQPLFTERVSTLPSLQDGAVLVAGTYDTKRAELCYIRDRIAGQGLRVRTVDLSTSGKPSSAEVPPHVIAACHRGGGGAIFSADRGGSVRAMAQAFEHWIQRQPGIAGIISAGGSGATALVTPAMRILPVGLPKVMISTVASGEVGQYVGPTDIMMMYSVTDVQGLNRISRRVLANGANALAGMVKDAPRTPAGAGGAPDKPGLALTMFGVTTTAVQQITAQLEDSYDCLVFHATGTGGRSMEKLADSAMLAAAIDLTTTEVCDMMMGGVFPATEDRFGAFIRTGLPYVGSVGALDMVNFGARSTVPPRYEDRLFVEHNPQVTLMRTTAEENARMGDWIAGRMNEMNGPVRFLIPEGGVSALDAPGQPFHDPDADRALFEAIARRFQDTGSRRLIRTPAHINDPAFTSAVVGALEQINPARRMPRHGAH